MARIKSFTGYVAQQYILLTIVPRMTASAQTIAPLFTPRPLAVSGMKRNKQKVSLPSVKSSSNISNTASTVCWPGCTVTVTTSDLKSMSSKIEKQYWMVC